MSLKDKITEKGEAYLEKQVKAMSEKNGESTTTHKRGRHKRATISNLETVAKETSVTPDASQLAKADCGKPQLSLVPMKILPAIARVREYGNRKYHNPDNWKTVEVRRYRDAALRHMASYIDNPKGVDQESGLPHLWHLACNIAFLISLEDDHGI